MYIRATKTHSNDGRPAYSYRLVRSERTGDRVRQKTLLNLGTNFSVPKELWRDVAVRVEELLSGQLSFIPSSTEVEAAAEQIVRQLLARGMKPVADTEDADDTAHVRLSTQEHEDPRSVGLERICLKALDDLCFVSTLQDLGVSPRDARIATALVVAKMAHPASERETSRWLRQNSAAGELLSLDDKALARRTLYRVGDVLWRHRDALQQALFRRERALLDLPETVIFYDLSNTYYTGQHNQSLLRFGRSKQRRNDCPLLTLALVLDAAGFPRSCDILPGNVAEVDTLKDSIRRFEAECGRVNKPTVVMDAGISSQANLAWLTEQGYHWICVAKGARPKHPPEGAADVTLKTGAMHEVRAWKLESDAGERRLHVVSEGRRLTDAAILEKQRERFETGLQRLHDGLTIPMRMKRYDRVLEAVGRLKERYPRAAKHYTVSVGEGEGPNATSVTFTRRARFAGDDAGSCVMRTSQTGWDIEKILRTYWKLTGIEATFRELKTELSLRPIWHQKEQRIQAHLFIAVLAYHAVHLTRTRLRSAGIKLRWEGVRNRMNQWVRITSRIQTVDGEQIVTRQDVRPSAQLAALARAAGVEPGLYRNLTRNPASMYS